MSTILSSKHGGLLTQFDFCSTSTAKQKFSFGKSPRLPMVLRTASPLDGAKYSIPGMCDNKYAQQRAPSFGVGDRFGLLMKNSKNIPYNNN